LSDCLSSNGVLLVVLLYAVFRYISTSLTTLSQWVCLSVYIIQVLTDVRFTFSTWPFACGCLEEFNVCLIEWTWQNSSKRFDVNPVTRSEKIWSRAPRVRINSVRFLITSCWRSPGRIQMHIFGQVVDHHKNVFVHFCRSLKWS